MSTIIKADVATHLNYQTGMFLTSDYMTLEQSYFSNWFWLQNQYLFSSGVLNGMLVSQAGNTLAVSQGVAFDDAGHFLILPSGATPVTLPSDASNPMLVYACYPDTSASTANVVNEAAQLHAAKRVPDHGVLLATVALDASKAIVSVTDSRIPVTSRLPAALGETQGEMRASAVPDTFLQGTLTVPAAQLQGAGASTSVTVHFDAAQQDAFSAPPTVMVTVGGSVPYATAVASGTAQFVVTLLALQAAGGHGDITLSWIALPGAAAGFIGRGIA
ncbi:hypothetical protein [Janthinobacterium sp. JC611]|uniref:hypothetical protein n=1 Tax=Janthinobacterium sp. JC611 TaxID=2816201 RepID=UPI001BFD417A|nr:hypothetical protein [Janthinobacterium sp. JC611]